MSVGTGVWVWINITSCALNGSLSGGTGEKRNLCDTKISLGVTSRQHIHIKRNTHRELLSTSGHQDTASTVSQLLAAVYQHH